MNEGQGNTLIVKLEAAIRKVEKGQPHAAVNLLNAFINQVKARIRGGELSAAQGQQLIAIAVDIIWQIDSGFY